MKLTPEERAELREMEEKALTIKERAERRAKEAAKLKAESEREKTLDERIEEFKSQNAYSRNNTGGKGKLFYTVNLKDNHKPYLL